ncbi:17314_t:CDS:2, partial [Acaulospora colombiana]
MEDTKKNPQKLEDNYRWNDEEGSFKKGRTENGRIRGDEVNKIAERRTEVTTKLNREAKKAGAWNHFFRNGQGKNERNRM